MPRDHDAEIAAAIEGAGPGGGAVHSTSLQARAEHHLRLACAALGCDAIVGRVMWSAGSSTLFANVEVGAAEGDVMKLKRLMRPPLAPKEPS